MISMHIGSRVAIGDVVGEIVTMRIVEDGLYVLNLRTETGGLTAVTVRRDGLNLAPVDRPPVDLAATMHLARRVLAGKEPRMPVAAISNALAAALVAVADGATPSLSAPMMGRGHE